MSVVRYWLFSETDIEWCPFVGKKLLNLGFARIFSHFFLLCTLVFLLHRACLGFIRESVWAKGSSNRGGLLYFFVSSNPLIFLSSHLYIFSPSHLHIQSSLISTHLHIFFSSLHLHICISSHLLTSSSYLHIFSLSFLPSYLPSFLPFCLLLLCFSFF